MGGILQLYTFSSTTNLCVIFRSHYSLSQPQGKTKSAPPSSFYTQQLGVLLLISLAQTVCRPTEAVCPNRAAASSSFQAQMQTFANENATTHFEYAST